MKKQCSICCCLIYDHEATYYLESGGNQWFMCEPCGICAERLGHRIEVMY